MPHFTPPTKSDTTVAELRAEAITKFSEQTADGMIDLWRAGYENFWQIRKFVEDGEGNAEITIAEVQAYLDAMGVAAVEQLLKSKKFVEDNLDDIPELYHSSPFVIDTDTTPGRVIVGEMTPGWATELGLT